MHIPTAYWRLASYALLLKKPPGSHAYGVILYLTNSTFLPPSAKLLLRLLRRPASLTLSLSGPVGSRTVLSAQITQLMKLKERPQISGARKQAI
jgi:hypothetical protein